VTTDGSKMGFDTALRIRELTKEVHIDLKRIALVGMRATRTEDLRTVAQQHGFELVGIIPFDENLSTFNADGRPLLDLPENSPSVTAVKQISVNLGLVNL